MSKELFFEIGTEEIPARFIPKAIEEMKNSLGTQFKELRLSYDEINIFSTPRRFAIVVKNLSEMQSDVTEELKGPAKKIAFDSDGNLTKAVLGFLKSKGATENDLFFKTVGKEEYAHVIIQSKGVKTELLLKDIFDKMIRTVTFPKSMRWGGKNLRFVRPIRWLICIFGEEHLNFDIEGIKTDRFTKGHRFLGASQIEVSNFSDYVKKLEENFVILEQEKRRSMILEQCKVVAKSIGGNLVVDEDILDEVNYIVEYPTAFYGSFRENYLSLPREVITTPMQAHQRYFPVVDDNGKLLNKFVTVRNGDSFMIDNVRKGNEKVLEARLGDAEFFYNEDTKHSLEYYVDRLSTITFQQKLGSILDKVNRMKNFAINLADEINFDKTYLERAVFLSKADLTTQMVFEFTELQGIMGRYYGLFSGEKEEVCNAIYEHYLPRNASDELPESSEGIILAIADRMDSLAGFFAIGITPTGSQDPFALRRQTLAIINILKERQIEVSIEKLIDLALVQYKDLEFDKVTVAKELFDFMMLRFENMMSEIGFRYDVIATVIELENNTVYDKFKKAEGITAWLKTDASECLEAITRVSNLSKDVLVHNINPELFVDKSEVDLHLALENYEQKLGELTSGRLYKEALMEFENLVYPINNLFNSVMIMDKNEEIKMNRLALLSKIKTMISSIGDIAKIVEK